jgi:hypothetical protein
MKAALLSPASVFSTSSSADAEVAGAVSRKADEKQVMAHKFFLGFPSSSRLYCSSNSRTLLGWFLESFLLGFSASLHQVIRPQANEDNFLKKITSLTVFSESCP